MVTRIGQLACVGLTGVLLSSPFLVAQTPQPSSTPSSDTEGVQNEKLGAPVPTSDSLTLSPGDLIEVNILGEPDLSGKFRVSGVGEIGLGVGGPISVRGLTAEQAAAAIEKRLLDGKFLREPHVTVFVDEYASMGVAVLGEVKTPGVYPIFGQHGLYDALSLGGGLATTASGEVTIIHRSDPQHPQIVTLSNSPEHIFESDVPVSPGDKIIASPAGVVYALGEVGRPGGFVLSRNETSYSVVKVLSLAEGFTHTAKLNSAIVIRKTPSGVEQYAIEIPKILAGKEADLPLKSGDILYVPTSNAKLLGYRTLEAVFTTVGGLIIYKGL
jgi:polysaccharide biosynthesis/export protein